MTKIISDNDFNDKKGLKWTNRLLVNHPIIDAQHKQIFHLIDQFLIDDGYIEDWGKCAGILTELTNYCIDHFRTETQYMKESSYPHINRHQNEHRKYIQKTAEFNTHFLQKKHSMIEEIADFLQHWWYDHIINEDLKFSEFIRNK